MHGIPDYKYLDNIGYIRIGYFFLKKKNYKFFSLHTFLLEFQWVPRWTSQGIKILLIQIKKKKKLKWIFSGIYSRNLGTFFLDSEQNSSCNFSKTLWGTQELLNWSWNSSTIQKSFWNSKRIPSKNLPELLLELKLHIFWIQAEFILKI